MNALTNLFVRDFQGIKSVDLIPSRVTAITGQNGSGKSALRDAIHHLYTGETARDVKLPQLVRQGGKTMEVSATWDNGTKITRKRTQSGTESRFVDGQAMSSEAFSEAVSAMVGTPIRTIGAAILTGHIFDLKLPQLLRVMQDITGVEFNAETIRQKIGEGIVAAAKEINIRLPESLDDFARAEKEAVEMRKAAKRLVATREEDLNRLQVPSGAAAELANKIITKHGGDITAAIEYSKGQIRKLQSERDVLLQRAATLRGRQEGEAASLEQRVKALKAEKDELEASGPDAALEAAQKAYSEVSRQYREVVAERAKVIADGKSARASIQSLQARIDELNGLVGDLLDAHPNDVDEIVTKIRANEAFIEKRAGEIATAERDLQNAKDMDERAQTHKSMSPCPVFPEFKCPVSSETFAQLRTKRASGIADLEKRLSQLVEGRDAAREAIRDLRGHREAVVAMVERKKLACELHKAEEVIAPLRARAEELKGQDAALQAGVEQAQAALSKAQETASTLARMKAEGKRLVAQLKALREAPADSGDAPSDEDVASYTGRIEKAQSVLEVMDLLQRRELAQELLKKADRQVSAADLVANACGPKGMKAKLINEATEPVVSVVNKALQRLAPEYSVTIDIEGDTPIRIAKGKGTVVSPKALSRGEFLRVGYVFQYAVASLTGQKVIVFDDVDAIDSEGAKALASIVNEMCDEGVQIFLMTHSTVPPGLTEEARIYRIEQGEVVETSGVSRNIALATPGMVETKRESTEEQEEDLDNPF